jgi:hypothetical protein
VIIDRHDNLTVAQAIYRGRVSQYPGRLVMLCDRARVLARSDRPETMPSNARGLFLWRSTGVRNRSHLAPT